MNVIGFDPGLTLQSAWKMSSSVKQATSIDEVLNKSDFISFHVPLIEATKGLINEQRLASLKKGVVVLNFARDGIVDDAAAVKGLEDGIIHAYVCDFPSNILKGKKGVIAMPHLGASTGEAEENCAIMVANQIKDYLENGNVVNSVNFPNLSLPRGSDYRVTVVNQNQPDMVSKISHVLGQSDINIMHMANESRGDVAYTIMDVNRYLSDDEIKELSSIDGVLKIRCLGQ
jgi:D-3-phosphoglycerate dehydrogenase